MCQPSARPVRLHAQITLTVHLFYIELLIVDVWLIIDVKTFFYVFYILVTFFTFFNTFLYLSNVFYFKKTLAKFRFFNQAD